MRFEDKEAPEGVESQALRAGELTIWVAEERATLRGRELRLRPKEFALLAELVRNKGRVLSREELLTRIWGRHDPSHTASLDVHISWLRRKMERNPHHPKLIRTVKGIGYTYVDEPPIDEAKQDTPLHEVQRINQTDIPPGREKLGSFRIAGQRFGLWKSKVLRAVEKALKVGDTRGAFDFNKWYVQVDNLKLSAKWVISKATGLPRNSFTTAQARSVLSRLDLQPQRVDAPTVKIQQAPADQEELSRRDFFENVITRLRGDLPENHRGFRHRVWENSNVAQVYYSQSSIHYELRLLKRGPRAEIGLHFETSQSRNLKLLDHFYPVVGELEQSLGVAVHAEPWGKYWARVYLLQPGQPLTAAWATEIAKQWARFINTTYPTLAKALEYVPGRGARLPKPRQQEVECWQTIAAERVSAIRAFLDGASGHMPSDETLCSWIEFCYTFELFHEGAALFERVSEEAVNEWLYGRTKKIAMACRHRLA